VNLIKRIQHEVLLQQVSSVCASTGPRTTQGSSQPQEAETSARGKARFVGFRESLALASIGDEVHAGLTISDLGESASTAVHNFYSF